MSQNCAASFICRHVLCCVLCCTFMCRHVLCCILCRDHMSACAVPHRLCLHHLLCHHHLVGSVIPLHHSPPPRDFDSKSSSQQCNLERGRDVWQVPRMRHDRGNLPI